MGRLTLTLRFLATGETYRSLSFQFRISNVMQQPPKAASKYYNYKHAHSIILLAVVGPNYEGLYADVGTNGRVSDGGIWSKCSLARKN